jgi:toxin ParE1/3/4
MAKEIRWSQAAANDLESIFQFIARDSEDHARSTAQRIVDATDNLLLFPRMGRIVPEYRNPDVRELIVFNYRVIYRVDPDSINIAGIIHGARQLKEALRGRKI